MSHYVQVVDVCVGNDKCAQYSERFEKQDSCRGCSMHNVLLVPYVGLSLVLVFGVPQSSMYAYKQYCMPWK